jgi:hypothetical protein
MNKCRHSRLQQVTIPRSSTASLMRVREWLGGTGRGRWVITGTSGYVCTSVSPIMTSRRGPDLGLVDVVKQIRLVTEMPVFTQLLPQGLRRMKIVGSCHVRSSTS